VQPKLGLYTNPLNHLLDDAEFEFPVNIDLMRNGYALKDNVAFDFEIGKLFLSEDRLKDYLGEIFVKLSGLVAHRN